MSDATSCPQSDDGVGPSADPLALRPGAITLAATPIGNMGDVTDRLRRALATADIIAAEDTRRLRALVQRAGIRVVASLVSFHEHNERDRAAQLVSAARGGARVLVVSDAGMPSVCDPGYRLVVAADEAGVPVTVAPGPSAVLTALALSGLATDRFCFEGFPPRRSGERGRVLRSLAQEPRTLIFFESPRRVHDTLTDMVGAFGAGRRAALCRELTKTHEDVRRATLGELAALTDGGALGEIVLVVAGADRADADPAGAAREALALAGEGMRLNPAAGVAARAAGLRPNEVYRAALELRDQ